MRRARIESIGVSLPRHSLFRQRALDHALRAGRECLAQSHHRPSEVGLLINAGIYRDRHIVEPAVAAYVQHGLKINIEFRGRRTLSFDLQNGACGMLNAAQVMQSLLNAEEVSCGMVVSSEANTDRRPDPSAVIPASGAAVMMDLSPRAESGFGSFAFHTAHRHLGLLSSHVALDVARGRLAVVRAKGAEAERALEEAYLEALRPAVEEALESAKLRPKELGIVIPAQTSSALLSRLPAALGVERERLFDLAQSLPDTGSTSLFIALSQAMKQRDLTVPGKVALLLAFGSGITVGAATYRF